MSCVFLGIITRWFSFFFPRCFNLRNVHIEKVYSLKMSKEQTLVTPHHHTSISDRDERENKRPNGDVCSEQTYE
jgi:hypothetical protein